jgi:hypothetical protein
MSTDVELPDGVSQSDLNIASLFFVSGLNVFSVIMAGCLFFVISSWYNTFYEYYRNSRGIPTDYKTTLWFAVIWTIITILGLIFSYYILYTRHSSKINGTGSKINILSVSKN